MGRRGHGKTTEPDRRAPAVPVMNPVAQRLRDRNTPYGWAGLADTAAAEIDRLEAEAERLRRELELAEAEIDHRDRAAIFPAHAKEAEIERLQKAYASRGAEMDTMREVLATTQAWNARLCASNTELVAALQPFAANVDGPSLSEALGHIGREELWAARVAIANAEGK